MRLVKETAKKLLPDAAVRRMQRGLAAQADWRAHRRMSIDLSKLELIREAPLDRLCDPSYLEHELLPRLGLNGELPHEFPRSLHPYMGHGLLHWQYPNQFSKYLVALSECQIGSYLEIGSRHGGTFVITTEYLSRFLPLRTAVAVDLHHSRALRGYAASREGVRLLRADSHGESFAKFLAAGEHFDLVLVDGDHSEDGCRQDVELVCDRARVLVLHDIVSQPVPGVGRVWRDLRRTHAGEWRFLEFTEQYPELKQEVGVNYLGIGMAVLNRPAGSGSA